jgi:hypothetical protein
LIGAGATAVFVAVESAMVLVLVLVITEVEGVIGSSSQKTAKAPEDTAGCAFDVEVVDLAAAPIVVASVVVMAVTAWAVSSVEWIEFALKLGEVAAAVVTAAGKSAVDELAEVKPKEIRV